IAQPTQTKAPASVTSTKDQITVVTSNEPVSLDMWDNRCSANIDHMACEELATDSLTWIEGATFEVVPLSGIESWEQREPHVWRFKLRPGVKFHNGEPWNAAAAKLGIDLNGDSKHGGGFSMHSFISGAVVDDLTVDVICQNSKREASPCPIFPRTGLFHKYQAPQAWNNATPEQRARVSYGFGPYKITGWDSGVKVTLEAYADYKPNKTPDSRAPLIKNITQVWRQEALVRTAMLTTGEADWADNVGFENITKVPQAIQSGSNEIFILVADTIWHPELKKKQVRMALAHAIDCPAMLKALYDGRNECFSNISQPGTLGINEKNSKPYEYNPTLAKQLLKEAAYDPANEIRIYTRVGRVYRDSELLEAVVGYWREVGVTGKLIPQETAANTAVRRSGCGQFNADPSYADKLDCGARNPPGPFNASTHYYATGTSNEALDYSRQGLLRLGCFDVNSRVCDPELQKKIDLAKGTPLGDLRRQRLEEVAQIAHDEYYFIPFFHVQAVYGAAKNLDWKPRYDPRIRVNTMRFK
ncbi:MAG TPA: ABC transporter substrate-binding protein, partial [Dehalococcoidia bacterium]|nr:ABC transporter substrate-binding protein [Dehalococcoidia bacterium]